MLKGIDVSQYQGQINWVDVANSKLVDFAFIRATIGVSNTDDRLLYNATNAHNNGIKLSYYHVATINDSNVEADARAEALFLIKTIKNLPKPDYPLILDLEANKSELPPAKIFAWVSAFFQTLFENSFDYILYSYRWFLDANLPANHGFGNVLLWIASYTTKPTIPKGWNNYYCWQFTNVGRIPGIKTVVDINQMA